MCFFTFWSVRQKIFVVTGIKKSTKLNQLSSYKELFKLLELQRICELLLLRGTLDGVKRLSLAHHAAVRGH